MLAKQKIIQYAAALFIGLTLIIVPVAAQAAAVDIPCKPSQSGTGDLFNCVNQLYKYALVICSIAAIIMIMIGGYMYIFSGGSEKRVSTAKSFIQSSLVGIAVLLVGFVLLRQINPSLLTIKSITPSQIGFQQWLVNGQIVTTNNPPAGAVLLQNGKDIKDCQSGIKAIPVDIAGRTGESGCQTLIDALARVKEEAAKLGVGFQVTDAYGKGHQSICHKISGTCADLVPTNNSNDSWNKLCQAVNNTKQFRILNEYDNGSVPACGKFTRTAMTTGDHIHIVLQNTIDDLGDPDNSYTGAASWPTGQVQGNGVVCNGGSANRANEPLKCNYTAEIAAAASEFGIDANLIRTVIHIESNFENGKTSSAGARGLMQITPDSASGCNATWATDPKENIRCGAKYLRKLLSDNAGSVQAALARYNSTQSGAANSPSSDCPGLARWQCAFDNAEKTKCNTGFVETRNYILNYQALSARYQSNACK